MFSIGNNDFYNCKIDLKVIMNQITAMKCFICGCVLDVIIHFCSHLYASDLLLNRSNTVSAIVKLVYNVLKKST